MLGAADQLLLDGNSGGCPAGKVDPDEVGPHARKRFDGLVDRFSVYASYPAPLELWDPLVAAFR